MDSIMALTTLPHERSEYVVKKVPRMFLFIDFIHITESINDNNYEGLCW